MRTSLTLKMNFEKRKESVVKMGKSKKQKEDTKKVKKANKTKKIKNTNKKKIWPKILLVFGILIIIGVGICAGLIVGLATKYAITKEDLIINLSNSIVVDSETQQIAVLNGTENRKILAKSEMGKYLPDAFVAIEDKRFEDHHGVDILRTGKAMLYFILNKGEGSSVGGGSTITQQLVKNITNEKDDSGLEGALRKVKEMIRAYQVEDILSKDQILEMYMNIIFLGGNVHGVGMASQYYFSKDATDLSLAESAFIAGITNGPNGYDPFGTTDRSEKIKVRTNLVLFNMKDQGKITEEEYNTAVAEVEEGLKFKKGKVVDTSTYSSHTEAMVKQIINQLVTEKGMDKEYAETYLLSNGFTIYSTEVDNIQAALEKEYAKTKYQTKTTVTKTIDGKKTKVKEAAQSAMVVIDHKTGYVLGAVGTLGEKTTGNLNRVNEIRRQPGSSIKPIAVYGPALEEGLITAASVYDDVPVKYGKWSPSNAYSGYKGLSNMRQAIRVSSNTVAVQLLKDLDPTKALSYLKRLGVTSMIPESDNNLSLALGGITKGISPLQMAGAYATIANDGEYITPTFYTKVVDSNGKIIIEANQPKERVFSKQNAYILKELLIEPTNSGGTATACKISGIDVAAKTGTTSDNYDKWLCGFTPYYTAATWYGYDTQTTIPRGSRSNATTIWDNVMTAIHKGLKSASFKKPDNIITVAVCKDSGLRATDLCKNDPRGNRTYTENFAKGTAPEKTCTCHVEADICTVTNKVAGEFCRTVEKKICITRETEGTSWKKAGDAKYMLPDETCVNCLADTTAPVISIIGGSTITLTVGDTYIESGATAYDDVDGDVSAKIIIKGTPNKDVVGNYLVTYEVVDSSGNIGTATRTVVVKEKVVQPPVVTPPATTPETETPSTNTNTNTPTDTTVNNTVQ